jgi:short subunit dehydrogenase-like uncharacterized protein
MVLTRDLVTFPSIVIVSESGIALLPSNRKTLPKLGQEGGILTPTTAIGEQLAERLTATGYFDFETGELVDGGRIDLKKLK